MRSWFVTQTCAVLALSVPLGAPAKDMEVHEEVGEATQACSADKEAYVYVLDGDYRKVMLEPDSTAEVRLPVQAGDFSWYCGDEIMRAGNNIQFNLARGERDGDEVNWTFILNWSDTAGGVVR